VGVNIFVIKTMQSACSNTYISKNMLALYKEERSKKMNSQKPVTDKKFSMEEEKESSCDVQMSSESPSVLPQQQIQPPQMFVNP
jgi:hypothetical protein